MKITDELLNKYIDNELTTEELVEFNKMLSEDEGILQKLKALQFFEQSIKNIEVFKTSPEFTNKLMRKVIPQISSRAKKNYFFRTIVSFFTFLILSVSGYMISILVSSNLTTDSKELVFSNLSQFTAEKLNFIEKFLTNPNTLMITSSITLFLLLSLYFIIEFHVFSNRKFSNIHKQ